MSQPILASQISGVLDESLRTVFAHLCTQRYGAPVSLRRVGAPEPSSSTVRFQIERAGRPALEAEFAVRYVGGNMYDVQGMVEGGPSRSFSYCLPEPAPLLAPKVPRFTLEIATFLLDVLERRLGRDLLRAELQGPSAEPGRQQEAAPPAA